MANRPVPGISMGAFEQTANGESSTETALTGIIVVLGRAFFAFIFLLSAPRLLTGSSASSAAQHGLPMAQILVPVAGVIAALGALSILLGYRAKIGAWLIVLFLAIVTPVMHNFWAVADPAAAQAQMVNFLKNFSMLGGALLITQLGAGPWSLDARRK